MRWLKLGHDPLVMLMILLLVFSCVVLCTFSNLINMWLFCSLCQVALDYIGKRGATVGVTREKRIKYVLY